MGFFDFFRNLFSGIAAIGSAIVTFVKRIFKRSQQQQQEVYCEERPQITQSRRYENNVYYAPQPQPQMVAPAPMPVPTPVAAPVQPRHEEMTWSENPATKNRQPITMNTNGARSAPYGYGYQENVPINPPPVAQPRYPYANPNVLNVQFNNNQKELTWSDPVSRKPLMPPPMPQMAPNIPMAQPMSNADMIRQANAFAESIRQRKINEEKLKANAYQPTTDQIVCAFKIPDNYVGNVR